MSFILNVALSAVPNYTSLAYWGLPLSAIGIHEYLFMEKETGIEIWNSQGGVTFSSVAEDDGERQT